MFKKRRVRSAFEALGKTILLVTFGLGIYIGIGQLGKIGGSGIPPRPPNLELGKAAEMAMTIKGSPKAAKGDYAVLDEVGGIIFNAQRAFNEGDEEKARSLLEEARTLLASLKNPSLKTYVGIALSQIATVEKDLAGA